MQGVWRRRQKKVPDWVVPVFFGQLVSPESCSLVLDMSSLGGDFFFQSSQISLIHNWSLRNALGWIPWVPFTNIGSHLLFLWTWLGTSSAIYPWVPGVTLSSVVGCGQSQGVCISLGWSLTKDCLLQGCKGPDLLVRNRSPGVLAKARTKLIVL